MHKDARIVQPVKPRGVTQSVRVSAKSFAVVLLPSLRIIICSSCRSYIVEDETFAKWNPQQKTPAFSIFSLIFHPVLKSFERFAAIALFKSCTRQ